jgi:hypothetical protein
MTAVASSVFTAAQFNTFLRDNLNETAPAKASTAGSHFAVSGPNEISERLSETASVLVAETTTSTSFTDLTTVGPSVTVDTGPAAWVVVHGSVENTGAGSARMAYDVSGATAIAAADNRGIGVAGTAGTVVVTSGVSFHTDLTPGSNTFTAKYRVASGTGTFQSRRIAVLPL